MRCGGATTLPRSSGTRRIQTIRQTPTTRSTLPDPLGQLAEVLRGLPAGVVAADADGEVVFSNPEAERIWRRPIPLGPAQAILRARTPEGRELCPGEWPLRQALAAGAPVGGRTLHITRGDGTTAIVVVDAAPVRDVEGVIVGAIATVHDITAQRRAEARDRLLAEASALAHPPGGRPPDLAGIARLLTESFAHMALIDIGDDGDMVRAAAAHADPAMEGIVQALGTAPPDSLFAEAARGGRSLLIPHVSDEAVARSAASPAELELRRALDVGSALMAPVVARGRTIGAILTGRTRGSEPFDAFDEATLAAVCAALASAVDATRLLATERAARAEAEAARRNLARLQRVTAALSGASTRDEVARLLAEEGVAALGARAGGVCFTHGDELRLAAAVGYEPSLLARFARFSLHDEYPISTAVRERRPVFMESPAWRREVGIPGAADFGAAAAVPLLHAGRAIGAIGVTFPSQMRTIPPDARALLLTLAQQCAQALERAALYEHEHRVAHALQRSLVPPRLPAVPGFELAARYLPLGDGNDVGGDFYDVFPAPDGSWIAVIGDVCGKGPAAGAMTAMVRYALRTAVGLVPTSAMAVREVNRVVHEANGGRSEFSTLALARIRPTPDGAEVEVLAAAHPPPMHVHADGRVDAVEASGGLVGPFTEVPLVPAVIHMRRGDALVLYTDGVTEARRGADMLGPAGLTDALRGAAGASADVLVTQVEGALHPYRDASGLPDDVALLVLKALGAPRDEGDGPAPPMPPSPSEESVDDRVDEPPERGLYDLPDRERP